MDRVNFDFRTFYLYSLTLFRVKTFYLSRAACSENNLNNIITKECERSRGAFVQKILIHQVQVLNGHAFGGEFQILRFIVTGVL